MRRDEFPIVDKVREEAYQQGRKNAVEEFWKYIDKHSHISEDGSEVCLDDDITILAEQFNEQEIVDNNYLSKENLISAIRFGETLVNPNDDEFDRGFHNGLEWMFNYITGENPDYVVQSKEEVGEMPTAEALLNAHKIKVILDKYREGDSKKKFVDNTVVLFPTEGNKEWLNTVIKALKGEKE